MALTLRAHHRHCIGLPRAALADDVEACAVLFDAQDEQAVRQAEEHLERRLGALVDRGDWTAAVRTAVTFDGSGLDPLKYVEDQARQHDRADIVEQLAAFRAELAGEGDGRKLVAAFAALAMTEAGRSAGQVLLPAGRGDVEPSDTVRASSGPAGLWTGPTTAPARTHRLTKPTDSDPDNVGKPLVGFAFRLCAIRDSNPEPAG
jgi:hypothetical protein